MEAAPAPPPPLSAAPPGTCTAQTASVYPESFDSSPRSRLTDSWDADRPPPQPPQKLRLMCSYGGHIVPRPHDKSLCYVGGDTRIIVIDRHTSLADLNQRLSQTLLHSQSFSLKYQIPNEDLDSLISVTTEEDLENMVEEYDRLNNSGGGMKPGRLRLFLFPKTSSSIEQLVETGSAKSEDWFFNTLNGKTSTLSGGASDRGFSESSSINNLLGLDDDSVLKAGTNLKDSETQLEGSKLGGTVNSVANQDVHLVPDSPMLETNSSFGSTSSSPSVANLPPIKLHVEENPKGGVLGIEDQFQQMNVAGNVNWAVTQKPEEMGAFVVPGVAASAVVSGVPMVVGGEYANRVSSDDERPDYSVYRNVQQIQVQGQAQLQLQQNAQFPQKHSGITDLPSPDSASSEGSGRHPLSRQAQAMYQESLAQGQSGSGRVTPTQTDLRAGDQNSIKLHMQQQVQDSGYILSGQYDQNHPHLHHQQQFVPVNQYIPAGGMPVASYYPIYPSQQQHHPHQPVLDQQYPMYYVQTRQPQAYNFPPQQPTYGELASSAPSSRPQTPPVTGISPNMAYTQAINDPSSKPELATGMYRTAAGGAQQLVQVPAGQQHAQYVGYSQIHHPSQSVNPNSAVNTTFAYEYADPNHAQMYYAHAQHLPPHLAAHYQTLMPASTMVLPDASTKLPTSSK